MIWLTNLQWNTAGDSSLSSLQKRRQVLVLYDMEWEGELFTPSWEIARSLEQVKWFKPLVSDFLVSLAWVLLGVGYNKEALVCTVFTANTNVSPRVPTLFWTKNSRTFQRHISHFSRTVNVNLNVNIILSTPLSTNTGWVTLPDFLRCSLQVLKEWVMMRVRTLFNAKKSLESMSFLVRPQHKQLYLEDLSVFAPFRYLGIRVGQSKGLVKKYGGGGWVGRSIWKCGR